MTRCPRAHTGQARPPIPTLSLTLALLLGAAAQAPARGAESAPEAGAGAASAPSLPERAQGLRAMQAEVQDLVAEARRLEGQLYELRPRYGSRGAEALRAPLTQRLSAIRGRLASMNEGIQGEIALYHLEAGTRALGKAVAAGETKPPPKLVADFIALESFHTEYWEYLKGLSAFLDEDERAFESARKEAASRRRRWSAGAAGLLLALVAAAWRMRGRPVAIPRGFC